ncbi:MAG: FecR domain-containing protein [Lachnospiraceae bacterium]|nr:FecR domain-containing protein [Lachnospiraceae bacterium]
MKKALIIIGAVVAVAAVAIALIFFFKGKNSYRLIKVFEVNGTCEVERNGDKVEAFKDMSLSSGDVLTVAKDGFTRLKLDDDKYVYLQADTRIRLTATGNENNSKTMVFVERGFMTTEVKKKLSAQSSYDIVTPNTAMSIRGTITHTKVTLDNDGNVETSSAVTEGQVDYTVYKKGENGETIAVEKTMEAGEGYSVSTGKSELIDEKVLEDIIESGLKASENKDVTVMTPEEADIEFKAPAFTADELKNIAELLGKLGSIFSQFYNNLVDGLKDVKSLEDLEGLKDSQAIKDIEGLKDSQALKDLASLIDGYSGSEGDPNADTDSNENPGSGDSENTENIDEFGNINEFTEPETNLDTESLEKAIGFLKGFIGKD